MNVIRSEKPYPEASVQIVTEILFIFSLKIKRLKRKAGHELQKNELAKQIASEKIISKININFKNQYQKHTKNERL